MGKQTEDTLADDRFKGNQVVVEQVHAGAMQPDPVAINDQIPLPPMKTCEEQPREVVPDTTSTLSVPPTEPTTAIIMDTVQNDAFAERPSAGDQREDGDTPYARDTTRSDSITSASPCWMSPEPSHDVEATTMNTSDIISVEEPIPSGGEPLSEANEEIGVPKVDVYCNWIAEDNETATTVVLPAPPSTDPILSRSETIAPTELDVKPPQSEATPETLYITPLSPKEAHEQWVSYMVGELPKVTIMVPQAGPQTTNQEVQIQEEKEAQQAAEKIKAERDELERSGRYSVEPKAAEETKAAPVSFMDDSIVPVKSATEGKWWALTFQYGTNSSSP